MNEFLGDNAGLIIAEVELASEDQIPEVPSWVGYEVTEDPRYINANLAKMPFTRWSYRAPNFGVLEHGVIKTVQEKMWGLRPYWGRPGRCR